MKFKYTALMIVLAGLATSSCKKQQTEFPNPYAGGKPPLGIVSDQQQIAVPEAGLPGTDVTITATGLMPYYEKKELKFLFNGVEAVIKNATATNITVTVPALASTGITSFVVGGQLVFGPLFTVQGKVNLDPTFATTIGTDGPVLKAYAVPSSTNLILLGDFNNYDNKNIIKPIRRLTRVSADGAWDRSFLSGGGANAALYDMTRIGPYYYIAGAISGYAQQSNISRITRINTSGVIDTTQVITYKLATKYVPSFNGGVTGGLVTRIYPVGADKMIVTGNFNYYVNRDYKANTYDYKDSTIIDSTQVTMLARINIDGTLDKTWRFDPNAAGYRGRPGRSLIGPNGNFVSLMHTDGKLVCWGNFVKFDNVDANRIARLTAEGGLDNTFNIGTGANNTISFVSYNAARNKYLVCGIFNTFNGKPAPGLVLLNYDGSVDESFTAKGFEGGFANHVKLLDDGLAVVSGFFRTYGGVARNGFMFLNATGALAEGYNNTGNFTGSLSDIYETRSADNKRALLLMGGFSLFDSKPRNNIVRITIE
ncbi:DUF5008 domain-containing protein [Mucilaginibacter myungsuensis]|uniref:DUF5008 domain-containing protein n=1 Tax=Mucilaginibacter myungsuensis TaxID=649104 RepID=A0A929L544_9SPHI|nr:DUF5008 domain-containing protein [Mucilaginibacter myungsuensis]MBE9664634.1 DUF5008 domain-containing protein [Mucilaginibacter myungsuensis]MDN3601475.1 DUF5008 domain-containing protein [Mucilaginibacter myungsuensis]